MATVTESDVIKDVVLVEPDSHGDERGRFVESYRRSWFPHGREMVQANRSDKQAGALVGLHYHLHQADYWYVARGTALVALHDLRTGSPTDGRSLAIEIGDPDSGCHRGVFIPPGVAHGFLALTDITITYLVDQYYNPEDELGVAWDDPALGFEWPRVGTLAEPIVSARDRKNPRRADLPEGRRPYWGLRR